MARANISLRVLGEQAGVSHAMISRLRRGEVLPDIRTTARLENTLGAPLRPGLAAARLSPSRGAAWPDGTYTLVTNRSRSVTSLSDVVVRSSCPRCGAGVLLCSARGP
ncbi:helix-turn-helix domain-containing protein, partial [Streptomyces sp. NPDC086549]|uniref:helix-turn-helix domain-containing protein n=1 Tax=Streptomyces sp. NPDC086549 TaxID=3365752 RepID=UPI0037FF1D01